MDRSWKGSGVPKGALTTLSPPCQGPRGGVGKGLKPLPRGKRGFWEEGFWGRDASKPPVAQRAGGIRRIRSDLGFMSSRLVKMFLSIVGTIWAYFWPRIQGKQGENRGFSSSPPPLLPASSHTNGSGPYVNPSRTW